jgi:CRP-like cAMP-binding protein/CheY-like chemotaxis protein
MPAYRILIIMEQHDEDHYLRELLTMAGYEVLMAFNGKSGIAMAQAEQPDAILCEVFMPEMDGFSVLVVLSKQAETATIPFVFFAHTYHKADIRKGMELGADDYLSRPFSDVQLLNALAVRIRKRENQLDYFKNTYRIDQNKPLYQQGKLALELLKDQSIQRKIKKKQILFYEGDKVIGIYYVRKGAIKVTKIAQDGRELTVRIHSTGDYIGLHNLYNEHTHTDNAEAMSDCEISILPIQEFEKLIEHHPEMASKFIHLLSQESSKTEEHLIRIAYDSVRKRIANSLISYFKTYCPHGESIHLSRNELANISGTTPETVSRTLTDFEQEGLIRKDQNRIVIINAEKLHYLKN